MCVLYSIGASSISDCCENIPLIVPEKENSTEKGKENNDLNILISLNEYNTNEPNFTYNEDITYNNITIEGAGTIKDKKECIQLLDSFKNLKTKELTLKNIQAHVDLPELAISFAKSILHRQKLEIQSITFKEISYGLIIKILERYSSTGFLQVVIESSKSVSLDMIEKIPISNTYKRITVNSIDYSSKTLKKATIHKVLPVLYEMSERPFTLDRFYCNKYSKSIKEILSEVKSCTVYEYEGIIRLQGREYKEQTHRKLEIRVEKDYDFSVNEEDTSENNINKSKNNDTLSGFTINNSVSGNINEDISESISRNHISNSVFSNSDKDKSISGTIYENLNKNHRNKHFSGKVINRNARKNISMSGDFTTNIISRNTRKNNSISSDFTKRYNVIYEESNEINNSSFISGNIITSSSAISKELGIPHSESEFIRNEFTDVLADFSFSVDVKFRESVALTVELLIKILKWSVIHVKYATELRIYNVLLVNEQIINELRIEIEEMIYLKYLSIEDIGIDKTKLVLKDITFRNDIIRSISEPFNEDTHTIILPLSAYSYEYIQYKKNDQEVFKNIYRTPTPSGVLTLCNVCKLKIFLEKTPKDVRKYSNYAICLEKIKNITWEKFCTDPSAIKLEQELKKSSKNISKDNFTELVEKLLRKGIMRLKCGHNFCLDCLNEKTFSDENIKKYKNTNKNMNIECQEPECYSRFTMSPNFNYAFNVLNTSYINDKYIIRSARKENEAYTLIEEEKYVLLPLESIEPSTYYSKISSIVQRPNFIIRKRSKRELQLH